MSDPVQIALISGIVTIAGNAVLIALAMVNRRRLTSLEKNTNGMKDELVEVTRTEAYAKGLKDATDEWRERVHQLKEINGIK